MGQVALLPHAADRAGGGLTVALSSASTVRVGRRHAVRAMAGHPWIERLTRFGFVVRGLIYFIPGVLALGLALGVRGAATTTSGAIEMIGRQPYGRILLIVVAAGLAGYALWGMIRVFLDPMQRGHSFRGLARRVGYGGSAIAYAWLFVVTVRLLMGGSRRGESHDWVTRWLSRPFGAAVVALAGIWTAGAGIAEIVRGCRGSFEKDLRTERMSPLEHRLAAWMGRTGIVARGLVLAIIGVTFLFVVVHPTSPHELGMSGALLALARQPFGRFLLGGVATGLISFGLYSALCSRWARMRPVELSSIAGVPR